ncbi:UAA transporter [Acaromyces ingoldii]|uniref:UDP-galactose transporter homolog 1 n=1 Tax=Acaromyces ingoldii TaxID=215250 RepID=A0A316YYY0_9BASI|nr:UAA transporter [Acaromyces ingoldii]PWN94256.1 UAA transporter [Acaromyces ingoldii]
MSLAQLGLCTGSIYVSFLLWALLQERLTTTPYVLPASLLHPSQSSREEYFSSPLVLNALQALFSTLVAATYLSVRGSTKGKAKESWAAILGLDALTPSGAQRARKSPPKSATSKGEKGNGQAGGKSTALVSPLLLRYVQIAASQSLSSLLALHSLSHGIPYPTLTLAKSCKLVPVLLANVVLYRRRFAPYKYVVVTLVTLGISLFMLAAPSKKKSSSADSSLVGLLLLLANQALDGTTNSTQDEVFGTFTISGPQMMLVMNFFSFALMAASLVLPMPSFFGGSGGRSAGELARTVAFVHRHPEVSRDLIGYALAGSIGQVAIFETLERFGSLTLVAITVTRKLFTMLLSIVVYKHALNPAQWLGVLVVFFGLGIEAQQKRKEGLAKKVAQQPAKKAGVKDA